MDFTINIYKEFLATLKGHGYQFITVEDFFRKEYEKFVILRHDVDNLPYNSLYFAEIQANEGLKGTYYFRIVPESYNQEVIQKIVSLGHEIGYHYEDMDLAYKESLSKKFKNHFWFRKTLIERPELYDKAWRLFTNNLRILRDFYPVVTICMHGSPRSPFDNKSLWNKFNYHDIGIIGEPYLDIDFTKVFYLTDTGRRWDGSKVSMRDKVNVPDHFSRYTFKSTRQLIQAASTNTLPEKLLITFHPQRWSENIIDWTTELASQQIKNLIKRYIYIK